MSKIIWEIWECDECNIKEWSDMPCRLKIPHWGDGVIDPTRCPIATSTNTKPCWKWITYVHEKEYDEERNQ